MQQLLTRWLRKSLLTRNGSSGRRRGYQQRNDWMRSVAVESLEQRTMLDVTFAALASDQMSAGKDLLVALDATDSAQNPISYVAQSSDANVSVSVVTGGRSLRMSVSGVDGSNQPFSGVLTFRLFEDLAPNTTARIIELVEQGFYNDDPDTASPEMIFHRIIQNFMVQGGDPTGTGSGGTGVDFADEYDPSLTFTSRGLLAMANSGDDSNDSQFFVTDIDVALADRPEHLNFQHTIFGILTSGFDTYAKLIATPVNSQDRPLTSASIDSIEVFQDDQRGVVRVSAPEGFSGSSTITVTADSGVGPDVTRTFVAQVSADTVNDASYLGAVPDVVATEFNTPIEFDVEAFDLEGTALQFTVGGTTLNNSPQGATAQIVSTTQGTSTTPSTVRIRLTPATDFTGTVSLTLGVTDNNQATADTQHFSLFVGNGVNDTPTAEAGQVNTVQGTAVQIQLVGDDGDLDLDQAILFEIVNSPQSGTITNFDAATGTLTYTPDSADFIGADAFTFRVRDDGGTDNGAVDVSVEKTFTINVLADQPDPPENLDLATASDNGLFDDDDYTSVSTPTITLTAEAGATVQLQLNGLTVTAVEGTAGQFSATLTREQLRVGTNSVTATATVDGQPSSASTALTFVYAPSFEDAYTVPHQATDFTATTDVVFNWTSRQAAYDNEIGIYVVDDLAGSVDGILPGQPGYAAAALSRASRQVVFASGAGAGASMTATFDGGEILAYYMIRNDTTANFLSRNSANQRGRGPIAYFSFAAANPDGVDHMRSVADPVTGNVLTYWEDMYGGGDQDYNDIVIQVTSSANAGVDATEALRVPAGAGTNVPVTVTLQPTEKAAGASDGNSPSASNGEFGVYVVDDLLGTVNGLQPGDTGYRAAVLSLATGINGRQVLFDAGDQVGSSQQLNLPGGELVGFYYTTGGTTFFSFDDGNEDGLEHFRWFGPEGVAAPSLGSDGLNLHVLDELFGSEFDDFMLSIDLGQ